MEDNRQGGRLIRFLSTVYIIGALWLLGAVCGSCYPAVGNTMRDIVAGLEDSPVRSAFSVLAEGLENGAPIVDTVTASVEVLMGEQA